MLNKEALRQFSHLSSLLAVFSIMITVSLLSLKDKRKIVSWVIGVMVLASVLFRGFESHPKGQRYGSERQRATLQA